MEMHERIQKIMDSRGMTQADISRATGLSTSQVSMVISGRTKDPRISTIYPIAEALNVSLDYLVFGTMEKIRFADEGQSEVNYYYESMNDRGRDRLVDEAKMLANRSDFAKSEDHKVSRTA